MKLKVPFYANTSENTHCYQAALRMVLKYYIPEKEYTWKELEEFTAKKEGLWTWATQGIINMRKLGFEVITKEDWDYNALILDHKKYLIKKYGLEAAKEQIKWSDMDQEVRLAKEYVELFGNNYGPTNITELKELLDKGYLIICNVNHRTLINKEGYAGHFVVIYGYDTKTIHMHDPGPPPEENRKVSYETFIKAWEYPNEEVRNILAFKLDK